MRQEVINIYTFDELSDAAKKVAVENWRDARAADNWHETEMITEDFCTRLREAGLPGGNGKKANDKTGTVEWSLSNCQGDGVAFYGPIDLDVAVPLACDGETAKRFAEIRASLHDICLIDIYAKITRTSYGHHYSHWNTMCVELDYDYVSNDELRTAGWNDQVESFQEFIDDIRDSLQTYVANFSKELESDGYDTIDAMNDDEYLIEDIRACEVEFTEDGSIH